MVGKYFLLGILVFGMTFIFSGCDKNRVNNSSTNGVIEIKRASIDNKINGTWEEFDESDDYKEYNHTLKLNNGNFETSYFGILVMRGTYTTIDGKITFHITHIRDIGLFYEQYYEDYENSYENLSGSDLMRAMYNYAKLYSRNEYEKALRTMLIEKDENITEREFAEFIDKKFEPSPEDYSLTIDGNKLVIEGSVSEGRIYFVRID